MAAALAAIGVRGQRYGGFALLGDETRKGGWGEGMALGVLRGGMVHRLDVGWRSAGLLAWRVGRAWWQVAVGLTTLCAASPAAPTVPPAGGVGVTFGPPPAEIPGAERRVYRTVAGFDLPIFVFAPAPTGKPAAMIVFFHGSGWFAGAVTQFAETARHLASLGLCAAVAEYRVKQRYEATPFDGLEDVRQAIGWMRTHAADWGGDPRRVAAAGGSAGAHLALCAALFAGESGEAPAGSRATRPDLLVLMAVPTDTTTEGDSGVPSPWFQGRERELSPLHHLRAGLPPMQLFQGTADRYVPTDQTVRFVEAAQALGATCDLILFEGRGHGFYNHPAYYREYPGLPSARAPSEYALTFLLMSRFLRLHGYLEGPTHVPPP